MKEILVTGGTGFIGRNIVPVLSKLGYNLCLLTKDKKRCTELFSDLPLEIIEGNINAGPPKRLKTIPDFLLHLAWQGLPNYESLQHIEHNFITNYNFIKGCLKLGIPSILVAGTCLEYGMKSGCLEVDDDCSPITPYGLSKHLLHKSLLLLRSEISFSLAWARLFYVTGNGQSPNSIIPQLDQAIDQNEAEFNVSGGEQLRDYVNVSQVADDLLTLIVQKSHGTFNICSGKPLSIRKLLEDRIKEKKSSIALNLGYHPYKEYEPFAFWGKRNIPEKHPLNGLDQNTY